MSQRDNGGHEQFAGEYFAGYVTGKALSVDNLFVFTVIMGTFAKEAGHEKEVEEKRDSRIIALVRRLVPTTETYDGDKFLTKLDGNLVVTPMLLALSPIGFTDVLFDR